MVKQGNGHVFVSESLQLANGKSLKMLFCSICNGSPGAKVDENTTIERSLTSECPGVKLATEQIGPIADGRLDFRGGRWIESVK